ncbi:MAG: alpha/beta fold hydrolase [Xanthobacter sp.]
MICKGYVVIVWSSGWIDVSSCCMVSAIRGAPGAQIPALVAAGYRVIVPDHAGHGASAYLTCPLGVAAIADDTEYLLAHLALECLDIVGLSLGGMVAMELALRHPAKIQRLVVANNFDNTATPEFRVMAEGWTSVLNNPTAR